jgi:hypothetical protein
MSQQGLRFTLDVDGLLAMSTAVVSFILYQNLSTPLHSRRYRQRSARPHG